MRSSLRWATVASPRSYRAIFLIFCLQTFKAAFLWCVGVRRSKFRCPCKVVSKNHSVRSCTLTIASCIQRTFSEQAYQTRENSDKPQKSVGQIAELVLFSAPLVKCSSCQTSYIPCMQVAITFEIKWI